MLTQPLLDKFDQLGLAGCRAALEEQWRNPHYGELTFEERLGLLLDVETTRRTNNRLQRRVRAARFPLLATMADLDLSARRGLPRAQVLHLAQGEWVGRHLNLLALGATGAGKTFLISALGRAVCEAGYSVRYERTSRLLQTLELARADGSYPQVMRQLAGVQLLILDDWLRDPLTWAQARDLLEILDDRYGRSATAVATQAPVADWHIRIPDPTLADALLDRLIHNAYRLELAGESMRKVHSLLPTEVN